MKTYKNTSTTRKRVRLDSLVGAACWYIFIGQSPRHEPLWQSEIAFAPIIYSKV